MKTLNTMNKTSKNNFITYGIVLAIFIFCAVYIETDMATFLFKGLMVPICVNVILAVSLNLTVGILGELSLGHAGFMCVGAFAGSFFSMMTQETLTSVWIRFPLAFIIGGLSAAFIGLLVGIPVLRLRGDYLAIVTLAFCEIIKNIMNNLYIAKDINGLHFAIGVGAYNEIEFDAASKQVLINGAMGITGTPNDSNYFWGFALIFITLIVILNLVNSRTGRAIMSIRDNRIAAESVGINITKHKLIAFVISAFFAGVAGVLYSHNLSSVIATKFDYNYSILVLVFVVLGGIGSMRGSVIAAIILTALPEFLRDIGNLSDYRMLIYAILLIAMMLINNNDYLHQMTQGVLGKFRLGKKSKKNEQEGVS
ncbi:MAG: branched-chain amino acid ABC transporter permease [Firmicutes bacterium]|nr:branched-chain amino acid ABC transporter permease [Bacillota bacterium]